MTGPNILLIDIETTPALVWTWGLYDQNISIQQIEQHPRIFCFAAKWYGAKSTQFYSEHHNGRHEMLAAAWAMLDAADIVVGWNSRSFDGKWLEGEFIAEGMGRPSPYVHIDLMLEVKRNGRFISNKLDYIAGRLLDEHKVSHEGFELWIKCMAGDEGAWRTMRRYNKKDVTLLEPIYKALLPWIKSPVNAALYVDDDERRCPQPTCASTNLERRGYAYTNAGKYPRFVCRDCGKWSRGARSEGTTELRGM